MPREVRATPVSPVSVHLRSVYARDRSGMVTDGRGFLVSSRARLRARLARTMRSRLRAERGQTSVEYLGVIVVVA